MQKLRKYWLQLIFSAMVLVFFGGHAADWWHSNSVDLLDLRLYDARMKLTMPGTPGNHVAIVNIDSKSLAEVGHWPWRRDKVALLVRQLIDHYGAGVVGFDVVFPERDDSSGLPVLEELAGNELKDDTAFRQRLTQLSGTLDFDQLLANEIRTRAVVLGYYFNDDLDARKIGQLPKPIFPVSRYEGKTILYRGAKGYGSNLKILTDAARASGHFNPTPDSDGVTRRVPLGLEYNGQVYESLSLAMVRTLLGYPPVTLEFGKEGSSRTYTPLETLKFMNYSIPVDTSMQALVPFRGGERSFTYLSAIDVMNGTVKGADIAGRAVIIGTTVQGLNDLRVTPVGQTYPGVEIHANLINAILERQVPSTPDYMNGAEFIQIMVLGSILVACLLLLNPLPATLIAVGLATLTIIGNFYLWQHAFVAMPLAPTLLSIALIYTLNMAYGYFFEARKQKQMSGLFGQYVPPELVEKMSAEPEKYSMEGQSRELTILFSDVRGFTTISESMEPKELTKLMNEFLTTLSDVIRSKHLGTIDKYMGDCVMAFWGAPIDDDKHARHAVLAGLDMLKAMEDLGPSLKARGWPEIHIGVGANTGRVTVGDMGSSIRKAYTVMGDAVNLASRLEGITKQYGVGMIVGETTKSQIDDITFRELDRVRVKGKDEPVTIYEPIGLTSNLDKAIRDEVKLFNEVLRYYRTQNWDLAELQLINLQKVRPDFKLYQVYIDRVIHFRTEPPPENWDGVFDFKTK